MGAGHAHSPAADDTGHPGDFRTKLAVAFVITAGIVVAQAVGAWVTGSLALLTDTAHALTDASGLLVALVAGTLMLRPPSPRRTWGFRRIEVVAALGQATLLLVVGAYAAIEGVHRLVSPPEVPQGSCSSSASSASPPISSRSRCSRRAGRPTSTCAPPSSRCSTMPSARSG